MSLGELERFLSSKRVMHTFFTLYGEKEFRKFARTTFRLIAIPGLSPPELLSWPYSESTTLTTKVDRLSIPLSITFALMQSNDWQRKAALFGLQAKIFVKVCFSDKQFALSELSRDYSDSQTVSLRTSLPLSDRNFLTFLLESLPLDSYSVRFYSFRFCFSNSLSAFH